VSAQAGEVVDVTTETQKSQKAKFVQIATLQYAAGWLIFALDESGVVWQYMLGRSEECEPLPRKRKGLPGRPASR